MAKCWKWTKWWNRRTCERDVNEDQEHRIITTWCKRYDDNVEHKKPYDNNENDVNDENATDNLTSIKMLKLLERGNCWKWWKCWTCW